QEIEVEHDHVQLLGSRQIQGVTTGCGRGNLVALPLKVLRRLAEQGPIIIDKQQVTPNGFVHAIPVFPASAESSGESAPKVKKKVAPVPSSLSAQTHPPCRSTMRRT